MQEIELRKLYKPNVSLSAEDIERNEQNKSRSKLIETINNSFFQGIMSPSWYADIDLWFKKFNFDEQVMMALFSYCFQRSALTRNYLLSVAETWSSNNVKTFSDLEVYFQKLESYQQTEKTIKKKLGLPRPFNEYEKGYIHKWTEDFGYPLDVIEIALKKTTSKTTISFDYLDKMITDWHDRDLKTSDEVQNFIVSLKNKEKSIKELEKKVQYNDFEQRSYDNLDKLYANSLNT